MSGNSTAPGQDPSQGGVQPLDAESLLTVLTFTLTLGPIALKFENQILLNVINTMAKFAMASQNFSIEASDLVNFFGARPQDIPYLYAQTDGPEGLANIVAIIAYQVEPLLPHERNTDVIVPLFSALTVMTTLAIALRLWSRHQIANGIKDFDFLAVLGYILAVVFGGLSVYRSRIEGEYMRYYDKSWDNIRGSAKVSFTNPNF
ncbi:hypothetical protein AA313_de0200997 [Arthrobotrys entomopaga]|nr:hypothetical protein AA313_de0200997 [Arthrobotrys entomopaga]